MNKRKLISIIITAFLLVTFTACANDNGQSEPSLPENGTPAASAEESHSLSDMSEADEPDDISGEVIISFNFERQSGWASNQFAIWIEDMDGNYINTLYATAWTANGGYASRPDSIACG